MPAAAKPMIMDKTPITAFAVTVTPKDWDSSSKAWRCPALRIPGAEVDSLFDDGVRVDSTWYKAWPEQGLLRWVRSSEHPPEVTVFLNLTQELSTQELTAKWKKLAIILPFAASILVAAISGSISYWLATKPTYVVTPGKDLCADGQTTPCWIDAASILETGFSNWYYDTNPFGSAPKTVRMSYSKDQNELVHLRGRVKPPRINPNNMLHTVMILPDGYRPSIYKEFNNVKCYADTIGEKNCTVAVLPNGEVNILTFPDENMGNSPWLNLDEISFPASGNTLPKSPRAESR